MRFFLIFSSRIILGSSYEKYFWGAAFDTFWGRSHTMVQTTGMKGDICCTKWNVMIAVQEAQRKCSVSWGEGRLTSCWVDQESQCRKGVWAAPLSGGATNFSHRGGGAVLTAWAQVEMCNRIVWKDAVLDLELCCPTWQPRIHVVVEPLACG